VVPVTSRDLGPSRCAGGAALLTSHGIARRLPGEAARRARVGTLYHRPPGGESWADVALRLRTLLVEIGA
jgi:broad specificity phosphatase PhoE